MIDWIISALENRLGVELEYLREIAATSRSAILKFMMFMPMAQHRGGLDPVVHHIAGLTVTVHQDCGTCVQIAINEAKRNGVPIAYLKAVIDRNPEALSPELQDVYHFAQAVVEQRADVAERRDSVRERLGEESLTPLSMAVAAAQVFPVVKRGMGHDVSCRLIEFDFGARAGEGARHPTETVAAV